MVSSAVRFRYEDDSVTVALDVTPLPDAGSGKTFLVLFNEQRSDQNPVAAAPTATTSVGLREQQLERELASTKDYLKTTIEDFEAAQSLLQTSNEELQSTNEELQSTNEELETSKEELQSTNEELVTLNEELHNRMAQLNVTSDDLLNVLNAATAAFVLVGMDLRILRFSSAAEKLLNLIPGDVGRLINSIRTVVKARDLEQTISHAINTIAPTEQKVHGAPG